MAQTGQLTLPARRSWIHIDPVTRLRVIIIVACWCRGSSSSRSGLLYRDVVPSLFAIARAMVETLSDRLFFWHLGTTVL